MGLFLCKCKSDEYMKNYVVLLKRINQILRIILLVETPVDHQTEAREFSKLVFILFLKSKLINFHRFWNQKTKQNLFKGNDFSITAETFCSWIRSTVIWNDYKELEFSFRSAQ